MFTIGTLFVFMLTQSRIVCVKGGMRGEERVSSSCSTMRKNTQTNDIVFHLFYQGSFDEADSSSCLPNP
jgi:hypothetical protein